MIGKVTDSETNQGLPGVNIAIKSSTTGTSTDGAGNFKLSVPKDKSALVFSYVGYANQEVAIANRTTINVSMISDNQLLSEVVVVSYSNQERRDVTGAVATIKCFKRCFINGDLRIIIRKCWIFILTLR